MSTGLIQSYFVPVNLTAIFLFCAMYLRTDDSIGRHRQNMAFRASLISVTAFSALEMADIFMLDAPITKTPVFRMFTSLSFISITLAAYFWLIYVASTVHFSLRHDRKWKWVVRIPLLVNLVLLFTPLAGGVYHFADGLVAFGPLNIVRKIIDFSYLIASAFLAVSHGVRQTDRFAGGRYIGLIRLPIFAILGSILSMVYPAYPIVELCLVIGFFLVFSDALRSRIRSDALTGLNNRSRIEEYMEGMIRKSGPDSPAWCALIDVGRSHEINGILGYEIGDKTLTVFSEALKASLAGRHAIIGRWDSDKFMVSGSGILEGEKYRLTLKEELKRCADDAGLGFTPVFSIGTTRSMDPKEAVFELTRRAENDLYRDKQMTGMADDDFEASLYRAREERCKKASNKNK